MREEKTLTHVSAHLMLYNVLGGKTNKKEEPPSEKHFSELKVKKMSE